MKIDVEDLSNSAADTEPAKADTHQAAFAERIRGLAQIAQELPITPDFAKALPAPVLVMSVTNFPAMAQEVGQALGMAQAAGNTELLEVLKKSLEVMKVSYLSCSEELEIRMPARATMEELGLDEPSDEN